MVLSLLAFVPLAAGVLWLAASERVLVGVELGWSQNPRPSACTLGLIANGRW
jgi:hypothetical protein